MRALRTHLRTFPSAGDGGFGRRDCTEVLVQLSAVKSAVNNAGKVILQDHIEHCIADAVRNGDMQVLEELNKAIEVL